jgi:hypothetical protein
MSRKPAIPIRVPNGRFAPGHPYIGRSDLHSLQLAKRRAILEAVSVEDALAVVEAMRREALDGNVHAAAVFLSYAVGKPESLMPEKDAERTFDVINLNKPAAELTPEQRRQRLAFLMSQQEKKP